VLAVAATAKREDQELEVFTKAAAPPRPTFPLVLASVTVAVLAMHADSVARYSLEAFWAGVAATVVLAVVVGRTTGAIAGARARLAAALGLPALGGAAVGVLVQAIVLHAVRAGAQPSRPYAVRDLGGLVDTTDAASWLLGGVVLGAVPALAVSMFLGLAARALRKLAGNDASESFSVAFTGATGVAAALGLLVVEPFEGAPLLAVLVSASLSLLVALLVDGSRIAFVRKAFAGEDGAFEVVPRERFAGDPSLAAVVSHGGAWQSVLVRVDRRPGSYRAAAAEPVALLAADEASTVRPLRRRRLAAATMLLSIAALGTVAAFVHGLVG
jgi:hypothetical protein